MSTVGTAYVVVRAISPALRKDISDATTKAVQKSQPDIDKAAAKAGKSASESLSDEMGKAAPDIGDKVGDGVNRGVGRRLRATLSRTLQRVTRNIDVNRSTKPLATRFMQGFARNLDKFKIPPLFWIGFLAIPALGGAVQILTAYVAAATSLIGAMGPAFAAAGGVATASVLVLGGAVGAMVAAFKTDTKALTAFKERIADIGKEFRPIGIAVQKAALPNLEVAFRNLTKAVPTLRTGLGQLGGTVSQVAVSLSRVVTSATNLSNLSVVFAAGKPQLTAYGSALGSLVTILTTLAAASSPIATRFAEFTASFFKGAEGAATAGYESGRLTAFMERAGEVAAQLGQIFGDTFRGLGSLFSASSDSGQTLLDRISALAARFAEWSASVGGQNALKAFFDNALPVVHEVNGLIADLLRLIVEPIASGRTDGVVGFIQALRVDVLPALQEVGQAAAGLGPHLTELTVAFSGLIAGLADSGALGAFVGTLSFLFDGITRLLSVPIVGQLAGWSIAFLGAAKAVGMVLAPIGGLSTVATILSPITNVLSAAFAKLGRILLGKFANVLISLGTKVLPLLITGVRALSTALLANPIGLVVLAVVALVAGLVLAYKKSETFRAIVDKVGAALKTGFIATIEWLKDLWAKVWPALVTGFNAVKSVVMTVVGVVVGYFRLWMGAVQLVWNALKVAFDFIARVFPTIFNIVTQPIQGIIQILTGAWQIISGIFTGNLDKITTGIANIVGGIVRFFAGMPARLIPYLIQFGTFLLEKIRAGATAAFDYIVVWLAQLVVFVSTLPGKVIAAIQSLGAKLLGWAQGAWEFVRSAFVVGINIAISYARTLPGRVLSAVSSLAANMRSAAVSAFNTFNEKVRSGISTAVSAAKALPGKVLDAVGKLGGLLKQSGIDLINGFKQGITDALGGLLKAAKDLAGKVVGAVKGALNINSPSRVFVSIGHSVGEGMVKGIKASVRPVQAAARAMTKAGIPDAPTVPSPATGSLDGGGLLRSSSGPGGSGSGGTVIQQLTLTVQVDDLARMSTVADFADMLLNSRVVARQTLRSGTVGA